MSNAREIFNILLLSISLTTVVVTLISFLIFKLRYSSKKKKDDKVFNLEGVFFNRYAPEIDKKNEEEINNRSKKKAMRPGIKMAIFSASTFLFIFAFLSFENYFSYRQQLNKNIKSAKNYRTLIENGMLKKHNFNPSLKEVSLTEAISPYLTSVFNYRIKLLNKKTIILIVDPANMQKSDSYHRQAISRWRTFLKRNNISFTERSIYNLPTAGIFIAPHLNYLSQQKREILKKTFQNKSISTLFTGFPGKFQHNNLEIIKRPFGAEIPINFQINTDPKLYYPMQFIGNMDLPAGQVYDHFPLDNSFLIEEPSIENINSLSRNSDYMGSYNGKKTSFLDYYFPENGISWSLNDPYEEKTADTKSFYLDLYFINLLGQQGLKDIPSIAPWKRAQYTSAFSFTLDAEEEFENIDVFSKLIDKYDLKGTFFLVSSLIEKHTNVDLEKISANIELASHGKEHKEFTSFTNEELFYMLQESRFDIEEVSGRPVHGLRPVEEKINAQVLSPIVQNKFSYVFGPKTLVRFSPFFLYQEEFIFVPRTLRDDFNLINEKSLVTPEDFYEALKNDFLWVQSAKGHHPVSFHTHIMGQTFYKVALNKFASFLKNKSKDIWIVKLDELASWWRGKSLLVISEIESKSPYAFKIENLGHDTQRDFDIICSGPSNKIIPISSLGPGEMVVIDNCSLVQK